MPSITNPSTSLSVSIQAPGFGRNFTRPGSIPTTRYGNAIPVAIAAKTAYVMPVGCPSVKPNTGPRNGPLHGVASTVLNAPFRKDPSGPSCECTRPADSPINPGMGNSHTPRNESAKANTIAAIIMLNREDVNCSPHARFSLPRPMLAATLAVASTKNTA